MVVLGALLASCAAGAPSVEVHPNVAVLDRSTVTIEMPLTPYGISAKEMQLVNRAADLLMERCLDDAGVPAPMPNRLDFAVSDSFSYFGTWVIDLAAQNGLNPRPEVDGLDERQAWDSSLTDEQMEVLDLCMDSDEWAALDPSDLLSMAPTARGESESFEWAKGHPDWKKTVDAYQACMIDGGYSFSTDDPIYPKGAKSVGGEQEVRMAVDLVECKDTVSFEQNLMDIVAAYELNFIANNEAALAEEQAQKKTIVDRANLIISRNS